MRARKTRPAIAIVALLLIATALAGCGDAASRTGPTLAQVMPNVRGADPRLISITKQASQLLPGEATAFNARLASLKGLPVVVNKWAAWCPDCSIEAPYFQQAAKQLGGKVAFLGVDFFDNTTQAKKTLSKRPVPYPSYLDPDLKISKQLPPVKYGPVTNIYDASGKLVNQHAGYFSSTSDLIDQIQRYAGPIPTAATG